jgi:hypothetical protein
MEQLFIYGQVSFRHFGDCLPNHTGHGLGDLMLASGSKLLEVFFIDDRLLFAGRFPMLCDELISVEDTDSTVSLDLNGLADPLKGHGIAVIFV